MKRRSQKLGRYQKAAKKMVRELQEQRAVPEIVRYGRAKLARIYAEGGRVSARQQFELMREQMPELQHNWGLTSEQAGTIWRNIESLMRQIEKKHARIKKN